MIDIKTKENFACEIEHIVRERKTDYIDAIITYSTEHNIEIDVLAEIIKNDQTLKAKIYTECMSINLVEKRAILPF